MQTLTTAAISAVFASLLVGPRLPQDPPRADGSRAWADFDGDGLKDVVALTPRGEVRLMKNLGDGRFEDVGAESGLQFAGASLVQWLDYDEDGTPDLVVGTLAGPSRLFRNQDGLFVDATLEAGLTHEGRDLAVAQLDFDGDGQKDLHFRTATADVFYRSLGAGVFEAVELGFSAAGGPVDTLPERTEAEAASGRESPGASGAGGRVRDEAGAPTRRPVISGAGGGAKARGSAKLPTDLALMPPGNLPIMALCSPSLLDQNAPANCISASSLPTLGMLYPLGSDFFVSTTGRVGIGTTIPHNTLEVIGDIQASDSIQTDADVQAAGEVRAGFGDAAEPSFRFGSGIETTGLSSPEFDTLVASTTGLEYLRIAPGLVSFSIAGFEAMRIASGRDVGIGTTSPTGRLQVESFGQGVAGATVRSINTAAGSGIAIYGTTQGSDATMVLTQTGSGSIIRGFNGGGSPAFEVRNSGRVVTTALQITGGGDLVEGFEATDECAPGTVVSIDPQRPGQLRSSALAYDRKVAGVVSGAGGVNHGIRMGQDDVLDGDTLVAMSGRVYVRCSTENGAIQPGDLLTTAGLAGHAMKATDTARSFGAVIGKAMTALDEETGFVLVLVNLQ